MTPETIALVNALLMLMEMLVAVFLEKTTSKTGLNSGLPSSRSAQDETARSTSGARGKGPKEKEAACANTRTVTVCEQSVVEQCRKCGEDLTDTASCGHERRTLVDIVFETVEHHVDAQIKRCPRCRAENRGRFPDTMPGPLQYGLGIQAWVVQLLVAHMVSLKRGTVAQGSDRPAHLRGHLARLRQETPPCPRRMGAGRHRLPACHAGHPCR